jgi:hypothetical protein
MRNVQPNVSVIRSGWKIEAEKAVIAAFEKWVSTCQSERAHSNISLADPWLDEMQRRIWQDFQRLSQADQKKILIKLEAICSCFSFERPISQDSMDEI